MGVIIRADCQRSLTDVEKLLFANFFEKTNKHEFRKIIESGENGEIRRIWEFNKARDVKREIDYRKGGWTASMQGEERASSMTSLQEFKYEYNSEGKLTSIIEHKINNAATSNIIHDFDYKNKQIVIERYNYVHPRLGKVDFRSEMNLNGELIDSIKVTFLFHLETAIKESIKRDVFVYDQANKLNTKTSFYSSNLLPRGMYGEYEASKLSSTTEYSYDEENRLKGFEIYNFDEFGIKGKRQSIQIEYIENKTEIKKIKVLFAEPSSPREMIYKPSFDKNGLISELDFNGKIFYYKVE